MNILNQAYNTFNTESTHNDNIFQTKKTSHVFTLRSFLVIISLFIMSFCLCAATAWSDNMILLRKRQTHLEEKKKKDSISSSAVLDAMIHNLSHVCIDDNLSIDIHVTFENDTINLSKQDQFIPKDKASKAPSLIVVNASKMFPHDYFTIVMADIDAPSPSDPIHSPFLHYIISNLKASPYSNKSSLILKSYYPVSPPNGKHRYVFFLFKQHQKFIQKDLDFFESLILPRSLFQISTFARSLKLCFIPVLNEFISKP